MRSVSRHVQLSHSPATQWRLFVYDFDSGAFDPSEAPFFVAHQAFRFVPANTFTNFLGPGGSENWTLPERENAALLYLGIGTSDIAPGTFSNNQIRLHLHSVSGPGRFALYNVDPFGSPLVHMNSRDGVDPAVDSIALSAVGGHVHVNWAFSTPGTYRVGLAASGRLAANGQTNTSPVVEYTFIVQDIPWRPRLGAARAPGGKGAQLVVHGETGRRYSIQSTTNFQQWSVLTNFISSAEQMEMLLPTPAEHGEFFRAIAPFP